MKRLYLLLIAICASLTIHAQTIKSDIYVNDSTKAYSTSSEICRSFTDKMVLSVALTKYTFRSGNYYYTMDLTVSAGEVISIPQNGRLLMKTADGTVVELKSISEAESEAKTDFVNGVIIKSSKLVGSYIVGEDDLQKMFNGVKKVRMEILPTNYEKEFKKDKVGQALQAEYNLLKDKIFSEQRKSDFSEGF